MTTETLTAAAFDVAKAIRTPTGRKEFPVRGKPYFVATDRDGVSLGYRKNPDGSPGTWSVRIADGCGSNHIKKIGLADDSEPANGRDVLSYQQAASAVRKIPMHKAVERVTIARALELYEADLVARGGLAGNVSRVRHHLPSGLVGKDLATVTADDLRAFRDAIPGKPATVNRTIRILKAALNRAAEGDETISGGAWRVGLKQKPNSHEARNVVLSDDQVRAVVAAAYDLSPAFGLFVEVAAVTGARPSQIVRLEVRDLQADNARVMMPTSKKGTGSKPRHIAVPVTPALAAKLAVVAAGRAPGAALLLRDDGKGWIALNNDHQRPFAKAAARAGLDPNVVTIYALRHSSIVRRIKANKTPLRTIAAIHDTSVVMIERNYSRDIDQHDESARAGLLDTDAPKADNVVALRGAVS